MSEPEPWEYREALHRFQQSDHDYRKVTVPRINEDGLRSYRHFEVERDGDKISISVGHPMPERAPFKLTLQHPHDYN